eukprot:199727-Rhodomonas_salina.3
MAALHRPLVAARGELHTLCQYGTSCTAYAMSVRDVQHCMCYVSSSHTERSEGHTRCQNRTSRSTSVA